jgi:protoporphyrinogen oxidase
VPQLYGESKNSILAMEYWANDQSPLWLASDQELIALAKQEIVASTLVRDPSLIENARIYRIPRSYPVYRRGYRELLEPIEEYLKTIQGLEVIGRYGAFKYNNQDHSILMGLLAADNVATQAGHDLWAVNCDYDNYQEHYCIKECGLVKA